MKGKPTPRSRASHVEESPQFPLLGYRPDIDGLRAVAVLAVIGFHAFPKALPGGFAGVDIFFVISGFLISNQILHRLENGDFTLADFYFRRIRRIFPALILVLAACYGLGWFALYASEFQQLAKHIAAGAAFVSNFALWKESGYFDTASRFKPLLHLWSLGVEEQFYLLWPITLFGAFKFRLKILPLIFAVLLASFGFNLYYVGQDASTAFYLPVTRFWELMAGAALACMPAMKRGAYRRAASGMGVLLIAAGFAALREAFAYPGAWALLPSAGAFLVLAAGRENWINRHVIGNRAMVAIGLISYPLYLWHWPLLSFADIVQSGSLSARVRLGIIAVSFVLAALTYWLIERPIRTQRRLPAIAFAAAGLLAVVGAAGWLTFEANGAPQRAANRSGNFANDVAITISSFFSDGSCRLQGIDQIRDEVCLSADHPQVLVVGDSHATALNSAPAIGRVPVKTLLISAITCLPFTDYVSLKPSERIGDKICADVGWQILGAARSHPEIQNVVISTRGPIYFSGTGFGGELDQPGQNHWRIEPVEKQDPLSTDRERFLRGFSKTISALEGYGRTVIFVIDVPELGFDAHTCIPGRPLSFTPAAVSPCSVPRSTVDARQADYRQVVKALAAEHPEMKVFDPLPLFCDDKFCHGRDDTHLLYHDGDHLSVHGSEVVWKSLLPLVR